MDTLYSLFPDVDGLLKLRPEDLAPILLRLALPRQQTAGFIPASVTQVPTTDLIAGRDYPHHKRMEVDRLINSAWNWLERDGFIESAPGMNGANGWRTFTPKGAAVANGQDMQKLRDALDFPRALLHPVIRESAWNSVVRSSNSTSQDDLVHAVRGAFVAVEEAIRSAGGYAFTEYGERLIKKAFDPDTGPMGDRDTGKPRPEREGLQTLFIGAMNTYRNPISHRSPVLEVEEAKDQLLLASHLLRIVDARRPKP